MLRKSEKSLQGEKSESLATFILKAAFCHLSALLKIKPSQASIYV